MECAEEFRKMSCTLCFIFILFKKRRLLHFLAINFTIIFHQFCDQMWFVASDFLLKLFKFEKTAFFIGNSFVVLIFSPFATLF